MLDDHAGYAAVASFTDSTNLEVAATVDSLVRAGATSLILDLRNNPGGLLAQGVAVAELFLDPGQKVVSTKGRVSSGQRVVHGDRSRSAGRTCRSIVLVNAGTASAAEIVAGRAAGSRPRDRDRAADVRQGKRTGGDRPGERHRRSSSPTRSGTRRPGASIDRAHPNHAARHGRGGHRAAALQDGQGTRRGRRRRHRTGPRAGRQRGAAAPSARGWRRSARASRIFRDALSAYAATGRPLRRRQGPGFQGDARDARRVLARDARAGSSTVPREIFDDAHEAIDRVVGAEIAQQAFGVAGAQRRAVHLDPRGRRRRSSCCTA